MHYDIDYSTLSEEEKKKKAIEDIIEYMGEERFNTLTKSLKDHPSLTLDKFSMYVHIAGVQGYPVKVWYDYCFPEKVDNG